MDTISWFRGRLHRKSCTFLQRSWPIFFTHTWEIGVKNRSVECYYYYYYYCYYYYYYWCYCCCEWRYLYWVYWSSDHPFQVYCKVRPLLYYKVRQVLIEYKMQQVSQSATEQGLQISSHDLGREGSRKARHAIKTGTASIGFFPDLFVHNYWNISHQTQSLHLSNTILKCL